MKSTTESTSLAHSRADKKRQPGGGRRLFLGLAVAFLAVLGVWIWGIRRVDELPDLGEPFDIDRVLGPIAIDDVDNAYVGYAEAKALQLKTPASMNKLDYKTQAWSKASDDVREFVEKSRPALEKWREASERSDALYHQPGELAIDTMLPLVQDMEALARLATLEASRLEEKGAMDQAWPWYRAMLRTSRHVGRRGVIVERLMGAYQYNLAGHRILHWAADPRVDAKMLRRRSTIRWRPTP